MFPTQIIVTRELKRGTHTWLRALSQKLDQQDLEELIGNIRCLKGSQDRELADSVLEVSIQANGAIMEKMKGDGSMGQALMELMEPQLRLIEKERLEEGLKEGLKKGIQGTVKVLRNLGHPESEIKEIIKDNYDLSEEEAMEYL